MIDIHQTGMSHSYFLLKKPQNMSKKVLVTGAYGFIGRNVARRFSNAGWTVVGIGHGAWRNEEFLKWGISEWYTSDITTDSLQAYSGYPEVIVHCAGSGSVGYSIDNPYQDFQRTVDTTVSVLEFVRRHAPQARVVYPSSAGVYGVAEKLPISESAPLNPASPYGVHKKISEEMCISYARHFGVTVTIVRLFSVYGNGLRKQLLWDACVKVDKGENMFSGSGLEIRDWLHVNDAALLLLKEGMQATTDCKIVNGGSGKGVTIRDFLYQLFFCFGRADIPQFSGTIRNGDPAHYTADISALSDSGWQPNISWQEGVREYVEWFRGGAQ